MVSNRIASKARERAAAENARIRYERFDAILRPLFITRRIARFKAKNQPGKTAQILAILEQEAMKKAKIANAWYLANGGGQSMSALNTVDGRALAVTQYDNMTPAVRDQVKAVRQNINIHDQRSLLNIGMDRLRRPSNVADDPLSKFKTKDIKEIGDKLTDMSNKVRGVDVSKLPHPNMGWIAKKWMDLKGGVEAAIESFRSEFETVHGSCLRVATELDTKTAELMRYIELLKLAYAEKVQDYHTYSILIAAIEVALIDAQSELKEWSDKAQGANDMGIMENVARINESIQALDRKKGDYLGLRMATIGTLAEYRYLGMQCYNMADKINTAVVGMLPIWKDKMLACIIRSALDQASGGLQAITEATNSVIVMSANQAADSAVAVQKTIEQELISASTAKQANDAYLRMITGTVDVIKAGMQRRALTQAEYEAEDKRLKDGMLRGAYETIEALKQSEAPKMITADAPFIMTVNATTPVGVAANG
jgi:uncharacterized protein YaaN involved in tellurite resistance